MITTNVNQLHLLKLFSMSFADRLGSSDALTLASLIPLAASTSPELESKINSCSLIVGLHTSDVLLKPRP